MIVLGRAALQHQGSPCSLPYLLARQTWGSWNQASSFQWLIDPTRTLQNPFAKKSLPHLPLLTSQRSKTNSRYTQGHFWNVPSHPVTVPQGRKNEQENPRGRRWSSGWLGSPRFPLDTDTGVDDLRVGKARVSFPTSSYSVEGRHANPNSKNSYEWPFYFLLSYSLTSLLHLPGCPPLLLPLLMPGDRLSQEGIYFALLLSFVLPPK